MSILFRNSRPIVAFDVENPDHRRWFAEFVKYRTWGRSPVRFMTEALDQDLVSFIGDKMLAYYLKQEFENAKIYSKIKARTKPKSKSTSSVVRGRNSVQAKSRKKQVAVQTPTQAQEQQ